MAAGAQAAVSAPGTAESQPTGGTTTRSLDRALGSELSTGDRNLDLLLDAQRKGTDRLEDSPAARAMPERPANGRMLAQPLPESSRSLEAPAPLPAGNRAAAPLAMPGQVLQAAPPGTAAPGVARDWSGGAGQGAVGQGRAGGGANGEAPRNGAIDQQLRDWIFQGVAFVKENLVEILSAWAVIALLIFGLKAYSRRI